MGCENAVWFHLPGSEQKPESSGIQVRLNYTQVERILRDTIGALFVVVAI